MPTELLLATLKASDANGPILNPIDLVNLGASCRTLSDTVANERSLWRLHHVTVTVPRAPATYQNVFVAELNGLLAPTKKAMIEGWETHAPIPPLDQTLLEGIEGTLADATERAEDGNVSATRLLLEEAQECAQDVGLAELDVAPIEHRALCEGITNFMAMAQDRAEVGDATRVAQFVQQAADLAVQGDLAVPDATPVVLTLIVARLGLERF